jgi:hypothetical protein
MIVAPAGGVAVPLGLVGEELVEPPHAYTAQVVATKTVDIRTRFISFSFEASAHQATTI